MLSFCLIAATAWGLASVGRTLRHVAVPEAYLKRIGHLLTLIAALSSAAAALGYTNLANGLIYPAVFTAVIAGALVIVFHAVRHFYAWVFPNGGGAQDGLLPVVTNACIALACLPGLALLWGMRGSDLYEYWTRFQNGVQVG